MANNWNIVQFFIVTNHIRDEKFRLSPGKSTKQQSQQTVPIPQCNTWWTSSWCLKVVCSCQLLYRTNNQKVNVKNHRALSIHEKIQHIICLNKVRWSQCCSVSYNLQSHTEEKIKQGAREYKMVFFRVVFYHGNGCICHFEGVVLHKIMLYKLFIKELHSKDSLYVGETEKTCQGSRRLIARVKVIQ